MIEMTKMTEMTEMTQNDRNDTKYRTLYSYVGKTCCHNEPCFLLRKWFLKNRLS